GRDGDALAQLPPLGHLERVRDVGIALGELYLARLDAVERLARGGHLELRAPLHLLDRLRDGVERQEGRRDLGERAEDADLRVVLFIDPEAGKARLRPNERKLVRRVL